MDIIPFDRLGESDLILDAIYEGGPANNLGADPLSNVLPGVGNMGGFRAAGQGHDKRYVALYTSGEDKDWPDFLDLISGQFIYYGDNKTPGRELHAHTGNRILKRVFDLLHSLPPQRELIPPFFIFAKCQTDNSARSMQFKGLAVPGYPGMPGTEDLVALWKTSGGQRFQNYRAVFTILDIACLERRWMGALRDGEIDEQHAPTAWRDWLENGVYRPLVSEPTTIIRSSVEQTPDTDLKVRILGAVFDYFRESPFRFERFAAKIYQMQDRRSIIDRITRGVVDGGRDAIGRYRLGLQDDPVYADFALEAKCYAPPIGGHRSNTVGVREVSRLISRLRHRQFGVLVTTSVIARQAYQEVREDGHPIIFICGKDIAEILIASGYNTVDLVSELLSTEFPMELDEEQDEDEA